MTPALQIIVFLSLTRFSAAFKPLTYPRHLIYDVHVHTDAERKIARRIYYESQSPRLASASLSMIRMSNMPPSSSTKGETKDAERIHSGAESADDGMGSNDPLLLAEIEATEELIEEEMDELAKAPIGPWIARGILLLVAIVWGTNFASVKYLETLCFHPPCNHPPSEAALARFGVAGLASLPFLIGQRKDVILAGLECGLWITAGYFTQALALATIPSGKTAFICSLTVVVVPLISFILYKKPITSSNLISAVIALSGVAILEGLVDFHEILGLPAAGADTSLVEGAATSASTVMEGVRGIAAEEPTTAIASAAAAGSSFFAKHKGDFLALGQPLGFGFSFMKIEQYVEKFKDVHNRVLTISSAQCVAVGLLSLLWVLFDFHGHVPDMTYMVSTYCRSLRLLHVRP